MNVLLEADEEVNSGVYAAYLRAQGDADLLDILQHLDPECYPLRADAVRREAARRRVLPLTVHGPEERFFRGLAVVSFLISGLFVLLTLLLTAQDAAGPRWPSLDTIPDGTPAGEVMREVLVGILRAGTVGVVDLMLLPLLLLTLAGWLLTRARARTIRADVKWLVLSALVLLAGAVTLTASPWSQVPHLSGLPASSGGFWPRLHTLLLPG